MIAFWRKNNAIYCLIKGWRKAVKELFPTTAMVLEGGSNNMDKTYTYTYFGIESNGKIGRKGLVGYKRGIFNPDDITKALGIQPFRCWKKGDKRRNGTEYLFSSWYAEKSDKGRLDVEAQCLDTIKNLKNKISILRFIKEQYDVNYVISVVPSIYREEQPLIRFNEEIIEFCYLTGTIINFDIYIYQDE